MKYMGSKNRIAKYILPIMLKDRKPNQWWVEPFVGGANMIDKVDGNRLGSDSNKYLIECLKIIRDNPELLPDLVTEERYKFIRDNKEQCKEWLVGYCGFALSFGGKFFGGYRRDVAGTKGCTDNMKTQSRRSKDNAIKQSPKLDGCMFDCGSYDQIQIPNNSIIYCDPPYANTTKYKNKFNHKEFWQWCREKTNEGHKVFISEYNAPDDFECIWQKEINSSLTQDTGSKKGIEKLFVYKGGSV